MPVTITGENRSTSRSSLGTPHAELVHNFYDGAAGDRLQCYSSEVIEIMCLIREYNIDLTKSGCLVCDLLSAYQCIGMLTSDIIRSQCDVTRMEYKSDLQR